MSELNLERGTKLPSFGKGGGGGGGGGRFKPVERPRDGKGTLLRIVKIYARWGRTILFAMLLTVATSLISVAIPYFVGRSLDAFPLRGTAVNFTLLWTMLAAIAVLYVSGWLIGTVNQVIMLKVSQKLVAHLRSGLFAKLQHLPLSFYDTRSHGDTMSRITNDVDSISSTIAQTTTQLISSLLTLAGSLVVMLSMNVPLTLVVLLSIPLVTLLTKVIAGRSRRHFIAQSRSLGQLSGQIEEGIMGFKTVKAFGRKDEVLAEFSHVNEQLFQSSKKAQIWSGFMMPIFNVINNLIFALVALAGGVLSVLHGLSVGTVVSFLSYSKQFGQPLNAIAGMFNTIQSALAGAERVFEIMDAAEEPADPPDAATAGEVRGDVEFDGVSFGYTPEREILSDVSFKVRAGEVVALVGETGAGKTTIVNLLTRFYDADKGVIRIDGADIRSLRRDSLRHCFSVVLQDTCLFSGTILDNIRYAKTTATDDEVIAAARLARAHDFIEKLPNGYQTQVSGSADSLSEGQKQLLAIARAILCDSPILILDEATSSVDTKTEKDIQQAMLTLMKGRTGFLIAHRLSTIRDTNRIMVIGDGRIMENGSHDELMQLKGQYYRMVISQSLSETE